MHRSHSLLDASSSDRPESDLEPVPSLNTGSSSPASSLPSPPCHWTQESPFTSTTWTSVGLSSAPTTCPPRRFYHRSSSHSENPLRAPGWFYDRFWSTERAILEQRRESALHRIACCHQLVTSLELARMTATRVGTHRWIEYWHRFCGREETTRLTRTVSQAQRRIDDLFRDTAHRLHGMLTRKQREVRHAATQAQIDWILQVVEERAQYRCERRRRKACRIMDQLCDSIRHRTNVNITPDSDAMMQLQRGVFGLDSACDYYPHRLDSGHTTVVLPWAAPHLLYDPNSAPAFVTRIHYNGTWHTIPPGFRPYGNYQLLQPQPA